MHIVSSSVFMYFSFSPPTRNKACVATSCCVCLILRNTFNGVRSKPCRILQEYIKPLQDVNLDYFVVFCVKTDCVQFYNFPGLCQNGHHPSSTRCHLQSLERGKIWGGEKREGKNLWRGKRQNGGEKLERR